MQVKKEKAKSVSGRKPVWQRIAPVQKPQNKMKVSIYGVSGTGKTVLACTFPKPLLLIGAEDGTASVYNVKGVDYVRIERSEDIEDLVDYQRRTGKYQTIVLDTLSSYQELVLTSVLSLKKVPTQLSWGIATQEEWGQISIGVKNALRELFSLSCNVVILAQQREFNTDVQTDAISPYVASAVSPSILSYLHPSVDFIMQTFIRESTVKVKTKIKNKEVTQTKRVQQFCLRIGVDPIYAVKFRGPLKDRPDVLVNPTYDQIQQLT